MHHYKYVYLMLFNLYIIDLFLHFINNIMSRALFHVFFFLCRKCIVCCNVGRALEICFFFLFDMYFKDTQVRKK